MKEYLVIKNHDSKDGVLTRGTKYTYNEVIAQQLIKKGFIVEIKTPVRREPIPTELLEQIGRKRSVAKLQEMLIGEKRNVVIEAINKRIKEL
jgi:hypothetical protein